MPRGAIVLPGSRPLAIEAAQVCRALPARVRGLAGAIADIDRDPDWPSQLRRHLSRLEDALEEHVRVTEGAGGRYAAVVAAAPRLAHGVRLLARDHVLLAGALGALHRSFDGGDHPAELRRCGAALLVLLDRHRQRGIDLLYEAYGTDIGGET